MDKLAFYLIVAVAAAGAMASGCVCKPCTSHHGGSHPAATAAPTKLLFMSPPAGWRRLTRNQLRVTHGSIRGEADGLLTVDSPTTRAVRSEPAQQQAVEAHFTYLGPTKRVRRLAGGQARQQIALKLRAQDSCNVVYVTWRIYPKPGVVVTVKHNPGQGRHAECGASGYHTVRPSFSRPAPLLKLGQSHALRAELHDAALRVATDGREVWRGKLGQRIQSFDGPVGFRSDNICLRLSLYVPPSQ